MNDGAELRTVADFLRWIATRFAAAELHFGHGTDNAWDEAVALVCGRLGLPWDRLEHVLHARLTATERTGLADLAERRIADRVPVPYLVGEAWFAGRRFLIEPGVLIPRSPIAELILDGFAPWLTGAPDRILDLCAGSGCIGIACAHEFADAEVILAELDPAAADLAGRNVALHGLEHRVLAVGSDLFDAVAAERFDLIVANPPYVDGDDLDVLPEEYRHEPMAALAGGADGLDVVRRILADAPAHLTPHGLLVVEVGNSRAVLERDFPRVPFVWPDFDCGGHGVLVIGRADLVAGLSSPG